MRLRNRVSPGMGNHHEIPRSSGYRLGPPDTKYSWHLHCPNGVLYIASRLTFRFVGVVCMTRPDQWRVILSAFICNKLRDTTSNEYTLKSKHL